MGFTCPLPIPLGISGKPVVIVPDRCGCVTVVDQSIQDVSISDEEA